MHPKEIRFKQRFENFKKAFAQLEKAVNDYNRLNILEKEGLIQRFEYTFELSWKLLKDYLEAKGLMVKFPRDTLKLAFETEIIKNGEKWMEMLEFRNITAHTYDEKNFNIALEKVVKEFYKELKALFNFFNNEK